MPYIPGCTTCSLCGLFYSNEDRADSKAHDRHCANYVSAVVCLGYTPNQYQERETLKGEAYDILCSSAVETFTLGERIDAALLLMRQRYDRSLETAINHKYYKQHPSFDDYVRMVLDAYSDTFAPSIYKSLKRRYKTLSGEIAPKYSYWFPVNSNQRQQQFLQAGIPLSPKRRTRRKTTRKKHVKKQHSNATACYWVYRGFDSKASKFYVGQTTHVPESRWGLHRIAGTGAFAGNISDATWKVIERAIKSKLNAREAYFIGYYDSYENGFNRTRGNDLKSYEKGLAERERDLADNTHPSLKLTTGE